MSDLFGYRPASPAREKLLDAYTRRLLDRPPVRCLRPDFEPNERIRAATADRLARRDMTRFLEACDGAGVMLLTAEEYADLLADQKGGPGGDL